MTVVNKGNKNNMSDTGETVGKNKTSADTFNKSNNPLENDNDNISNYSSDKNKLSFPGFKTWNDVIEAHSLDMWADLMGVNRL